MKQSLTIIGCCLVLSLSAQELTLDYPYNPDYENDGNVGVEDLLQLLAFFDAGFEVDDIVIDEVTLTQWLQTISQTLINQQATIDSLQGLTSALDSTMVADMISSYGGVAGGGCDYAFPEGINGQAIAWDLGVTNNQNDYTVPEGKNLYITNVYCSDGSSFRIDGIRVIDDAWGTNMMYAGMLKLPLCAKSGQVISNHTSGPNTFYGILTDAVVDPISFWFDDPGTGLDSYTVPNGKKLFITNIWAYGGTDDDTYISVDGVVIGEKPFNKTDQAGSKSLEIPLVINSGSVISKPDNYASFNGYLVDEDYFDMSIEGSNDEVSSGACQGELMVNYHGYDYELVEIDDQCWFKENLRTSQFQNGEDITEGLQDVVNPESGYLPAGNPLCGCVYNKAVIYDGREVCPSGFQIPKALDFSELIGSTIGWPLINESLTGFNALFGSGTDPLYIDGNNCGTWTPGFGWGNFEARFLTSTVSQLTSDSGFPDQYWDFEIYGTGWTDVSFGDLGNHAGQYVRCIKDTE